MTTEARSIRRYNRFFQQRGIRTVLDYGAGTLRNSRFLAQQGFFVYAADVPDQMQRILRMPASSTLAGVLGIDELEQTFLEADLVLSTYVLNIIPGGTEKWRYLKNVTLNLRNGGFLLIEARCRREEDACGNGCSSQGSCPSCFKTYTHDELDSLVTPFGFRRVSHYYRRYALAVLFEKVQA